MSEQQNLWDMLVEATKLDRKALKNIIFRLIYRQDPIQVAKDYNLSLNELSTIVSTFDEYTGYSDRPEVE